MAGYEGGNAGISSKAMKLLGLSKLPSDVSRAEHLALIRQHRSLRNERAKLQTPRALRRAVSSSSSPPAPGRTPAHLTAVDPIAPTDPSSASSLSGSASSSPSPPSHRYHMSPYYARNTSGRALDLSGDELDDDDGGIGSGRAGGLRNNNGRARTQEESPLRLSSEDVDDRFTRAVAEQMSMFPLPPTTDSGTDPNSPVAAGRSGGGSKRGDFRRGIHAPKAFHWRGVGGGEKHQHQKQQQEQQQQEQQEKQEKVYTHQGNPIRQPHESFHIRDDKELARLVSPQGIGAAGAPQGQPSSQRDTFEL